MRQLIGFLIVISLCGLAAAQSDRVPPGTYAEPFAPRLSTPSAPPESLVTPSLTLDTPSLTTGASSSSVTDFGVHFNQPVWYGPGVQLNSPLFGSSVALAEPASEASSPGPRPFQLGAATFQSSYGVAQLMGSGPRPKASRTYANADVARINDNNGMIRYGSKAERMN